MRKLFFGRGACVSRGIDQCDDAGTENQVQAQKWQCKCPLPFRRRLPQTIVLSSPFSSSRVHANSSYIAPQSVTVRLVPLRVLCMLQGQGIPNRFGVQGCKPDKDSRVISRSWPRSPRSNNTPAHIQIQTTPLPHKDPRGLPSTCHEACLVRRMLAS